MNIKPLTIQDQVIIKKHDPAVRGRAFIELQVVNAILDTAKENGYTVKVQEYEDDGETNYDVKDAILNLDEANLIITRSGSPDSWIFLVMGNDGYDTVSDYSTNLEGGLILTAVNMVADWWGN